MNRRTFLKAAALSVTAAPAWAIEPFGRPEPGPMKLALSAYSMRRHLTAAAGEPGAMDLIGFVDYCRDLGVPGAELTSYYFPDGFAVRPEDEHRPDAAYVSGLKRRCHAAGVSVSGGAIRNDFCVPGDRLPAQIEHFRRWLDVYADLGAPAVRVFAGTVPKGSTEDEAVARCAAALTQAGELAAGRGVFAAVENHGGITAEADTMLRIVREARGEWLGVNFDSGNFGVADPYAALAKIAPYAVNAQIKVEMKRPDGGKVPADLERVVKVLRDAGYGGWVALEYEGAEPPRDAVPRWLDVLRPLLT